MPRVFKIPLGSRPNHIVEPFLMFCFQATLLVLFGLLQAPLIRAGNPQCAKIEKGDLSKRFDCFPRGKFKESLFVDTLEWELRIWLLYLHT